MRFFCDPTETRTRTFTLKVWNANQLRHEVIFCAPPRIRTLILWVGTRDVKPLHQRRLYFLLPWWDSNPHYYLIKSQDRSQLRIQGNFGCMRSFEIPTCGFTNHHSSSELHTPFIFVWSLGYDPNSIPFQGIAFTRLA